MMVALFAWYVVSLTYYSREAYALLSNMCSHRAFVGTNPLRTALDGLLMMVVGVLLLLLPVVGLVAFPFTSFYLVVFNRQDWRQIKELTREGRIQWMTGTIADPAPADPETPVQKEPADGQ